MLSIVLLKQHLRIDSEHAKAELEAKRELKRRALLRRYRTPDIYFNPAVQWETRFRTRYGIVKVGVTCPHCKRQRFLDAESLFKRDYDRRPFTGRCQPCAFKFGKPRGPKPPRW
jgi:hypothetical protein